MPRGPSRRDLFLGAASAAALAGCRTPTTVASLAPPPGAARAAGTKPLLEPAAVPPGGGRYIVAAYYFPSYHRDARYDKWHGAGWTEWDLIDVARPRFQGHYQPLRPSWGYFDEANPEWAAREIDLAADHGLNAFMFDWYWYEDGSFLEDALNNGFLKAPNRKRMDFALMWANHDWQNIHPATFSGPHRTLAKGQVSRTAFDAAVDHIVKDYFSQPNYLKIDGEPFFSIYELKTLVEGLGGASETVAALDSFREKTKAAGHKGLHLNGVVWGVQVLPNERQFEDPVDMVAKLGLKSVGSYAWVHHHQPDRSAFPRGNYEAAAADNYKAWERYRKQFTEVPYYPNVSMGWDPSPRTVQSDRYEDRGYPYTSILEGNTPVAFGEALRRAKAYVDTLTTPERMITVNAWNEWTEGSFLLPEDRYGTAHIEQIRRVFGVAR